MSDPDRTLLSRVVRRLRRSIPGGNARGVQGSNRAGAGRGPGDAASPARPPDVDGEWRRLAGATIGSTAIESTPATELVATAARQRAEARLAQELGRGEPLERAVCAAVNDLAATGDWRDLNAAWALCEGVGSLPGGATAAALGHTRLLHRRGQHGRAWVTCQPIDDAVLATVIPVEAVDACLSAGTTEARTRALRIGSPASSMDGATLADLAGRFMAFGERHAAADLVDELRRRPVVELEPRRRLAFGAVERWLAAAQVDLPQGAIPVAIIDVGSPDPELPLPSVGDGFESLATLGNLARLSRVRFTGEAGLGELAGELQARVPPALQRPDVEGSVHLLPVRRDASGADAVPDGTWMVASGWHMNALFDLRYDFPYHERLRPLFVSFHVNRLDMLSDSALEYLRRYGPVGCRDWNTVFLLLGAGVDAFFTGDITTTVDALFPARDSARPGGRPIGVIDLPRRAAGREARKVVAISQAYAGDGTGTIAERIRVSSDVLAGYQRELGGAVTSRLRTYLALTALGVPVDFRTATPGDVRLAGLSGLRPGDPRLAEMQDRIRELMAATFEAILAGADEDGVYAAWRSATRDLVAEARASFEAPLTVAPTTIDVPGAVAASRAGSRRFGPHDAVDDAAVTNVVLCFDQNLTWPAGVLVESLLAGASGPLRLWVLGRGLPGAYPDWLAAAFPALPITYVPCDGITYGPAGRPRRIPLRITISTMDRLILPHLLDGIDRVVYLDVDTLMLDDVCRLAAMDLDGCPVAARDSTVSEAREWQRVGRRLPEPVATDLRRWMSARHRFGAAALNAGVLVMDLERLRRDDFTTTYLGWIEQFGLNDQDTMLAYLGASRKVLDPRWNALPALEDVHDPRVIHWASLDKPWEDRLTFGQAAWRAHADRLRARAGMPPSGDTQAGGVATSWSVPA